MGTWYSRALVVLSTYGTRFLGLSLVLGSWARGTLLGHMGLTALGTWVFGGTWALGCTWALSSTWALGGTWLVGTWHLLLLTCGYLVLGACWYLRRLGA